MSEPALQTKPRRPSWTPARRAAQAEAIRRWKPWANSTGPKSAAGKARSAQNAAKTDQSRLAVQALITALAAQRRYLHDMKALIQLRKITRKNELLRRIERNLHRRLRRQGQRVTAQLRTALILSQLDWHSIIMQKTCFSRSVEANS